MSFAGSRPQGHTARFALASGLLDQPEVAYGPAQHSCGETPATNRRRPPDAKLRRHVQPRRIRPRRCQGHPHGPEDGRGRGRMDGGGRGACVLASVPGTVSAAVQSLRNCFRESLSQGLCLAFHCHGVWQHCQERLTCSGSSERRPAPAPRPARETKTEGRACARSSGGRPGGTGGGRGHPCDLQMVLSHCRAHFDRRGGKRDVPRSTPGFGLSLLEMQKATLTW